MNKKDELELLRLKLDYIRDFIEQKCVYDKHLMGYCFDLKKGDVRRLIHKMTELDKDQ